MQVYYSESETPLENFCDFLSHLIDIEKRLFSVPGWLLYRTLGGVYVFVDPKEVAVSIRERRYSARVRIAPEAKQSFYLSGGIVLSAKYRINDVVEPPSTEDLGELLSFAVPPDVLLKAGISRGTAEVWGYRKKLPRRFVLAPAGWKRIL